MTKRRRHPRVIKPLDGTWRGQSGASPCRIPDISWGGCFIETVSAPSVGERTVVTVPAGGRMIEIAGSVQYVERNMGFAVQFDELTAEQREALAHVLGAGGPSTDGH